MPWRVLIVEDEPELVTVLRDNLELEGYAVISATTGEEGLDLLERDKPDVLILDLMLPTMSGYDVCRKVRSAGLNTRIIMLTARNTELDRIAGLDYGADDYMGKPFSLGELMARVRAQLRHSAPKESPTTRTFSDVTVDLTHREVRRGVRRLDLTSREFDLLQYFIMHEGKVLSREELLKQVWGYDAAAVTRTVDNFVARLRRHLEQDSLRPRHLLTIHGAGYRFVP
jgi:DNA-binding response OmpR family regulator